MVFSLVVLLGFKVPNKIKEIFDPKLGARIAHPQKSDHKGGGHLFLSLALLSTKDLAT